MHTVGMHEAKTRLSQLVQEVEAGAQVVISRNGQPVARLIRVGPTVNKGFGAMAGRGSVDDLDWESIVEGDSDVAALFDPSQ